MSDPVASGVWLVVGLGNPGREYEQNRHNIGFMVADLLADRIGGRFKTHKSRSQVVEGRIGGRRVVLAKPMTYMNLSGGPVAALRQFYKIAPAQVLALHDELDLPFGQVRAKFGGGEGGHNGLRSMSQSLGTKDYARTRFGIGRPPGRQDPADFVLSDFSSVQRKELDFLIDRAADIAEAIMTNGVEWAQNQFHAPSGSAPSDPS